MQLRSVVLVMLVLLAAAAADGQIDVVAVGASLSPDGNGRLFNFDIPSMNILGQVTFVASLGETTGGLNDNTAIFHGASAPGSLKLIVRKGNPSPDGNGNFSDLDARSAPIINDDDQVAFIAGLTGTFGGGLDSTGMFRGDGGSSELALILRQGTPLPGISGIGIPNFRGGGVTPFSFNEAEQVAFGLVGFGIYRSAGGTLTEIVHAQQPIPGGSGTFGFFTTPALNDGGDVTFSDSINGIFRGNGSTIVSIARSGEPTPDGNGTFTFPFINPAINNAGNVAFAAALAGTTGSTSDNQGIFTSNGTSLTTIVRRGQSSPDGNGKFLDLTTFDAVALNEAGQTAFLATLTNTAGGTTDNSGLFRGDGATLTKIVRTGDRAPDGSRITSVSRPALNDAGQVAFLAALEPTGGLTPHAILLYDDQRGLLQAVRTGDPLAGSRIAVNATLIFEPSTTFNGKKRSSLNEHGQIVFRFDLDDGRRGIAIANPLLATPTPTSTSVAPATATPSPTNPPGQCVGDCDQNGRVSVNELVRGVNIALSQSTLDQCPQFDCNSSGRVTVDCLVKGVNAALRGC